MNTKLLLVVILGLLAQVLFASAGGSNDTNTRIKRGHGHGHGGYDHGPGAGGGARGPVYFCGWVGSKMGYSGGYHG